MNDTQALDLGVDEIQRTSLIIVGSGVAGLSTALAAAPRSVVVITKSEVASGSSPIAQGGLAAAVGVGDSPALHAEDTERVARGLGRPEVIRILVESAPQQVERLLAIGARFDRRPDGELSLGREGGHGRNRILHANGDATGAEIVRALADEARRQPCITLLEHFTAEELILTGAGPDTAVVGVVGFDAHGRRVAVLGDGVVLATGGIGQVYRRTTNPDGVTGDGIAMASRAGARLVDMEFVQFHPTALAVDVAGGRAPLLTEALRGAGAHLIDQSGTRIMCGVHPDVELAPRDLVARTIWAHRSAGNEVFLDVRHLADDLATKFPTVLETCAMAAIDPHVEPIPVEPAAHYFMGGIDVDADGRSSLLGLWACGEAASTGVHGANRLASNSLLEALVFGARVAASTAGAQTASRGRLRTPSRPAPSSAQSVPAHELRAQLRDLMWRHVGLERDAGGLAIALDGIARLQGCLPHPAPRSTDWTELRNLLHVAHLVARAAHAREESRGAHFRTDFPLAAESWARRATVEA